MLSIADKADSIAGMFALGLIPSGSKDPFALRRQANGIIKTVAEHKLSLNLHMLFRDALAGYAGSQAEKKFQSSVQSGEGRAHLLATITGFYRERIEFYLREALGFEYDVVRAVLAAGYERCRGRGGAGAGGYQGADVATISSRLRPPSSGSRTSCARRKRRRHGSRGTGRGRLRPPKMPSARWMPRRREIAPRVRELIGEAELRGGAGRDCDHARRRWTRSSTR